MDKKILSTVIAGTIAGSMAFAANADVSLYGQMHLSVGAVESTIKDSTGSATLLDSMQQRNQASRLGVKGSEDLGGLSANFMLEWGVNPDNTTDAGFTERNQWVGLSGESWGEVRVGRHDTPLKMAQGGFDLFNDTDADIAGVVGSNVSFTDLTGLGLTVAEANLFLDAASMSVGEERLGNTLAYLSPSFSGFSFAGAGIAGEATADQENGATCGLDCSDKTGLADIYSLAAMYNNGPLFASLAYNDYDAYQDSGAKDEMWRGVVTYKIGDAQIGGLYETADFTSASLTNAGYTANGWDKDTWGINGKYSFGNVDLKAQLMNSEADLGAGSTLDQDQWSLGVDYNFSKRTVAYFMYTAAEMDENTSTVELDYDFAGVGMIHKF